jgi:hypothetical protein
MKKYLFILILLPLISFGQTNPIITKWLQNNSGITGRHYRIKIPVSTVVHDSLSANVQQVRYSSVDSNTASVYVNTQGIPAYITGPFYNNPRPVAGNQNELFKLPLHPVESTLGNIPSQATGAATIAVLINGVSLYSYGDGFSFKSATSTDVPTQAANGGDGVWNRNGVLAEKLGFDCSKGHPDAQWRYHHHQNPSAFNLDLLTLSTVCTPYVSDGLYAINPNEHSPLLGFAFDGFPIYGPYAYSNPTDPNSAIVRVKSSYSTRAITTRTHYANGVDVTDGPAVSTSFPLGWYREDYEYISHTESDYLDIHNGRFCITPDFPNGTYCYFTTVDDNYNSVYPYAVGPYFYGVKSGSNLNAPVGGGTITEPVLTYTPPLAASDFIIDSNRFTAFPNPTYDLLAIQSKAIVSQDLQVNLFDATGRQIDQKVIHQGSTLCYFDTSSLYNGLYLVQISAGRERITLKVMISK